MNRIATNVEFVKYCDQIAARLYVAELNLINPTFTKYGSILYYGEILTRLSLPASSGMYMSYRRSVWQRCLFSRALYTRTHAYYKLKYYYKCKFEPYIES